MDAVLSLLDDATSAADALIDGRIAPSTKRRYEAMIKTMREFWLTRCNRCYRDDATDIPLHLAMTNELCELVERAKKLQADLECKFLELPSQLANMLLNKNKFSINGAHPVTMNDLKALLSNAVNEMRAEVRRAVSETDPSRASVALDVVELGATDSRFRW